MREDSDSLCLHFFHVVPLANTPADEALKPCGDAYYCPSKVHIAKFMSEAVLIISSIPAMTRISLSGPERGPTLRCGPDCYLPQMYS